MTSKKKWETTEQIPTERVLVGLIGRSSVGYLGTWPIGDHSPIEIGHKCIGESWHKWRISD